MRAAARVALESEVLGLSWLFGADGTAEPAESLEPALQAIARSGMRHVVEKVGADLPVYFGGYSAGASIKPTQRSPRFNKSSTSVVFAMASIFSGMPSKRISRTV